MKILPVLTELFHADGRTDRRRDRHDKTNNAVRNFANAPKVKVFFDYATPHNALSYA